MRYYTSIYVPDMTLGTGHSDLEYHARDARRQNRGKRRADKRYRVQSRFVDDRRRGKSRVPVKSPCALLSEWSLHHGTSAYYAVSPREYEGGHTTVHDGWHFFDFGPAIDTQDRGHRAGGMLLAGVASDLWTPGAL